MTTATEAPTPETALHGVPAYAADATRHLLALLLPLVVVVLSVLSGPVGEYGVAEELWGWARIIGGLVVATVVGHVAVTVLRRGRVSLVLSALGTWVALTAASSLPMLGADQDAFVSNAVFSLLLAVPVVLVATVLRAFVPAFQVHIDGVARRPLTPQD